MNHGEIMAIESQRQALLGQLTAAEAALRANLELNCANVTARVHMQRALAHIQEAIVAINGIHHARTIRQLVEDLMKGGREFDELQRRSSAYHSTKSQRI
jgi:hypothetical protein